MWLCCTIQNYARILYLSLDSSSQRRQDNADEEGSAEARQQDAAGPSMSRKPKQFSDKGMPL